MGEIAIEQKVVGNAKLLGVIGLKLTTSGNTGTPDRMFLIPGGSPLFIEFKKPGEKPSKKQEYWIAVLSYLSYKVEVHDNVDDALQAICKAVAAARISEESHKVLT